MFFPVEIPEFFVAHYSVGISIPTGLKKRGGFSKGGGYFSTLTLALTARVNCDNSFRAKTCINLAVSS